MTKPFAFEELLARIEVLLRRASPAERSDDTLRYADVTVDLSLKIARRSGRDLGLAATEFALLQYLVENAERVVSRMEILNSVWGYDFDPHANIVEVYVAYLRKKVEQNARSRRSRNVRGFGYVLSEHAHQSEPQT